METMRRNLAALKGGPPPEVVKPKKEKKKAPKPPPTPVASSSKPKAPKPVAPSGKSSKKSKGKLEESDVLSFEQKKALSEAIGQLDGTKLEKVIQIIHEGVPEIRDVRVARRYCRRAYSRASVEHGGDRARDRLAARGGAYEAVQLRAQAAAQLGRRAEALARVEERADGRREPEEHGRGGRGGEDPAARGARRDVRERRARAHARRRRVRLGLELGLGRLGQRLGVTAPRRARHLSAVVASQGRCRRRGGAPRRFLLLPAPPLLRRFILPRVVDIPLCPSSAARLFSVLSLQGTVPLAFRAQLALLKCKYSEFY
jgi:hypothetical protein